MNITFENKRVLVTGACQGIGKQVALRMSAYKATVFALSNDKSNLDRLKKEHPEITTVCVDLLDWDATQTAVRSVLPIDLVVNCAGVIFPASSLTTTAKDFDLTFGVNVRAMLNVSQVVAADMVRRKAPGSIVNISSKASQAAFLEQAVYGSSKAAVNMLTKNMALELGPHNIRVNAVLPTVVMTELAKKVWSCPIKSAEMKKKIPLGRFAELDEVVDMVVFLLSDRSSMTTGAEMLVDGGFLAT